MKIPSRLSNVLLCSAALMVTGRCYAVLVEQPVNVLSMEILSVDSFTTNEFGNSSVGSGGLEASSFAQEDTGDVFQSAEVTAGLGNSFALRDTQWLPANFQDGNISASTRLQIQQFFADPLQTPSVRLETVAQFEFGIERFSLLFDTDDPLGLSLSEGNVFIDEVPFFQQDAIDYSIDFSGFDDANVSFSLEVSDSEGNTPIQLSSDLGFTAEGQLPGFEPGTGEEIDYQLTFLASVELFAGNGGMLPDIDLMNQGEAFFSLGALAAIPEPSLTPVWALISLVAANKRPRRQSA